MRIYIYIYMCVCVLKTPRWIWGSRRFDSIAGSPSVS